MPPYTVQYLVNNQRKRTLAKTIHNLSSVFKYNGYRAIHKTQTQQNAHRKTKKLETYFPEASIQ